jgi:hypothetical protein
VPKEFFDLKSAQPKEFPFALPLVGEVVAPMRGAGTNGMPPVCTFIRGEGIIAFAFDSLALFIEVVLSYWNAISHGNKLRLK